jgi:hypothetical protein
MAIASWNMISWDIGPPWNGPGVVAPPPPLPPLPPPLRLRESTRRVGVWNATARQESVAVNQEARAFFEFDGVSGMGTINPQDVHCKNFKIKTLPGD